MSMPEDLDEKLERTTQDFVARLETWLADRPPLSVMLPGVVDVSNPQPDGGSKLMNFIKVIAPI